MQIFLGEGDEKPREDRPTQERHSVVVAIKHFSDNKYLCLDAKGHDCKSFIMGGIEDGETPEAAAIRETQEETGYQDVVIDSVDKSQVINHFFYGYKNVNRYAHITFVYGHLTTDKRIELSPDESAKHTVKWIDKDELQNFINVKMNRVAIDRL